MHPSVFHRFVYSKPVRTFADQYKCGWQDGCCYILAKAISLWLDCSMACLYRERFATEQMADHYVASYGGLYIDSDGVHTRAELLAKWNKFEARNGKTVLEEPADPARAICVIQKDSWSEHIASLLQQRFGKPTPKNVREVLGPPESYLVN